MKNGIIRSSEPVGKNLKKGNDQFGASEFIFNTKKSLDAAVK